MIRGQTNLLSDAFLADLLVCPRDYGDLEASDGALVCAGGHRYPIAHGIPVMLLDDAEPTNYVGRDTIAQLGGADERVKIEGNPAGVDPYVQAVVDETGGHFYAPLVGKLTTYPIPSLRLPAPAIKGARLLDLGCNWGRWCVAAARLGYTAIGIDPGLEPVRAAYRVARRLDVETHYVVGDARHLPFPPASFAATFSYSVIQHFSKSDAALAFNEAGRVLEANGVALIQMANAFGLRSLYHQVRRRFREPGGFKVRYWTPAEMRAAMTRAVGPATLSIDGFFSLNPQATDLAMLPARYRAIVRASETLRRAGAVVPPLLNLADSIYISAHKPG